MAERTLAGRPRVLKFVGALPEKNQFGERLRLRVVDGPSVGVAYCLLADTISIGRDDACEISIEDDKASRRHIELLWKNNKYYARDLDSANGLLINTKLVKGAFVEPGDLLLIGSTSIEVIASGKQSQLGTDIKQSVQKVDKKEAKLKKNKTFVLLILLILLMVILSSSEKVKTFQERGFISFIDEEKPEKKLSKKEGKAAIQDFVPSDGDDRPGFRQAQRFYRDGMRELRNKNYRRAISAFETAQTVDPSHDLARIYVEVARKALEDDVNFNFRAAVASLNAHRYREAKGYFMTVIRLLEKDPQNVRYTDSKAAVEKLERALERGR
jgi:pSer/pThr/pTyr-binding forkhead associated (FHA) protein